VAIALAKQGGRGAALGTSPQTVAYTSAAGGNTLIITGLLSSPGVSAACVEIATVADSTGTNIWHWTTSTTNVNNPPYATDNTGGQFNSAYVIWSIGAAAVTGVTITLTQSDGNTWWRMGLGEFSGIGSADTGVANTVLTGGTNPTATLSLASTGDLVIGTAQSTGSITAAPSGWSSFTSGGLWTSYDLPGVSGSYSPAWTGPVADYAVALMAFSPPAAYTPVFRPEIATSTQAVKRASLW
jgi:hypothetical protein